MTKTNGGTFDNDAKACYDRIIMALASLVCRRLGLPKEAVQFMANLLQTARYRLKTRLGVSDEW